MKNLTIINNKIINTNENKENERLNLTNVINKSALIKVLSNFFNNFYDNFILAKSKCQITNNIINSYNGIYTSIVKNNTSAISVNNLCYFNKNTNYKLAIDILTIASYSDNITYINNCKVNNNDITNKKLLYKIDIKDNINNITILIYAKDKSKISFNHTKGILNILKDYKQFITNFYFYDIQNNCLIDYIYYDNNLCYNPNYINIKYHYTKYKMFYNVDNKNTLNKLWE